MNDGYRVTTIAGYWLWSPRTYRGSYGVVLCHGANEGDEFMDLTVQPASVRLAAALASAGYPCVAAPMGDASWGNDDAMAVISNMRTQLAAWVPTLNTDKVFVLGVSMGGSAAARYSINNPTEVAAVVGIMPGFNVAYEWENVPGLRPNIGFGWGVTYPTPLPADADNLANSAAAVDIPLLAAYSTADTVVPATGVEAYVDAVGGTKQIVSTVLDHSDAVVAALSPDNVIHFLAES